MSLPPGVRLSAFNTSRDLLAGVTDYIASKLVGARAVALTGGNTAAALYDCLATDVRADAWQGIHWFWGDDRFVPNDHPHNNAGTCRRRMSAILAAGHVHAVPVDAFSAQDATDTYATTLKNFYGSKTLLPDRPLFDLVLLVLGRDGHIASLLPGSAALYEREAWAAVVEGDDHTRVTLTYPILQSAHEVILIASGGTKRAALTSWFAGDLSLPITNLRPICGINLFADAAALTPLG